jgi:NDP-sugar pyrophosphorylase family protein
MNSIVIVGGGKGSRLAPIIGHGCKVLAPIFGRPWIQSAVELIAENLRNVEIVINVNDEHFCLLKSVGIKEPVIYDRELTRRGFGAPLLTGARHAENEGYVVLLLGDILFNGEFPVFLKKCFFSMDLDRKLDFLTIVRPPRLEGPLDYDVIDFNSNPPIVSRASDFKDCNDQPKQVGGCLIVRTSVIFSLEDGLHSRNLNFLELHDFFISVGLRGSSVNFDGCFEDFGTPERYRELTKCY